MSVLIPVGVRTNQQLLVHAEQANLDGPLTLPRVSAGSFSMGAAVEIEISFRLDKLVNMLALFLHRSVFITFYDEKKTLKQQVRALYNLFSRKMDL